MDCHKQLGEKEANSDAKDDVHELEGNVSSQVVVKPPSVSSNVSNPLEDPPVSSGSAKTPEVSNEQTILCDLPTRESKNCSDREAIDPKCSSSTNSLKNDEVISSTSTSTGTSRGFADTQMSVKPRKFVFLSDQKEVPSRLKVLQERTMRRRRHLLARMHDLDCHLAEVCSNFAEEKMDLDLSLRDSLDRSISQPLEAAAERLVMEREATVTRGRGVDAMMLRLTKLDHQMTYQLYVNQSDQTRDELDSVYADLFHNLVPAIGIENSKSSKIEFGVVRRFEDVAADATRGFHKECALRQAAVHQARKKVENVTKTENQRLDHILVAISELRSKTRKERAERREADARILESIVTATVNMKRALLEAVGNSN